MKRQEWISVDDYDRIPEQGESVLLLSRYKTKFAKKDQWCIEEHVFFEDLGFQAYASKDIEEVVTHWMPIELPEEYADIS